MGIGRANDTAFVKKTARARCARRRRRRSRRGSCRGSESREGAARSPRAFRFAPDGRACTEGSRGRAASRARRRGIPEAPSDCASSREAMLEKVRVREAGRLGVARAAGERREQDLAFRSTAGKEARAPDRAEDASPGRRDDEMSEAGERSGEGRRRVCQVKHRERRARDVAERPRGIGIDWLEELRRRRRRGRDHEAVGVERAGGGLEPPARWRARRAASRRCRARGSRRAGRRSRAEASRGRRGRRGAPAGEAAAVAISAATRGRRAAGSRARAPTPRAKGTPRPPRARRRRPPRSRRRTARRGAGRPRRRGDARRRRSRSPPRPIRAVRTALAAGAACRARSGAASSGAWRVPGRGRGADRRSR